MRGGIKSHVLLQLDRRISELLLRRELFIIAMAAPQQGTTGNSSKVWLYMERCFVVKLHSIQFAMRSKAVRYSRTCLRTSLPSRRED